MRVIRTRPRLAALLLTGTFCIGLAPWQAVAQVAQPGVPTALGQTREEIERGRSEPLDQTRGPRLSVEGDVERAPCPLADPQYGQINVTLSEVRFGNLTGVDPETLRPAYAEFLGRPVPIATVCEIRDRAATILRRDGYLAAVQVPAQRIENGVVNFDVLMAKLVGIQVRGDAGRSERTIAGYLEKIQEQEVFNIRDAERYLLLARDLPGFDVRLVLRPAGTNRGEVIGEVAVVRRPVEIDVNVQNFGSRDVGRFGGNARVQFNGLTGLGDRTTLGYFATADFKEQHVLQAGHAFKIGREGLGISGDLTYAWTKPSLAQNVDLESKTLAASLAASYPLIRSQNSNLFASGGFDFIDQNVRAVGAPLTEDHLRVVFARLDYEVIDDDSASSGIGYNAVEPRWRIGASAELRQGIDVFGASERCRGPAGCGAGVGLSRSQGDPTAFVARLSGTAEYRPTPFWAFVLSPRAQYAPNALLSYEQFSAGNYTVGRGYDPGSLIGDSGVGVQAEVRLGSILPRERDGFAFQPYAFFDAAWVWNEDTSFDGLDPQKLYSAGGGVRVAWGDRARLDLSVAAPLKRVGLQEDRGDVRVLMSLTARLAPWR